MELKILSWYTLIAPFILSFMLAEAEHISKNIRIGVGVINIALYLIAFAYAIYNLIH